MTLEEVNALSAAAFTERFGAVFEHSPWVAASAAGARPFASLDDLHAAMVEAVDAASPEDKLALIRAHPELAGRAAVAGDLTAASRGEQAGAGLDRLTPAQHAELLAANAAYAARFGFPFVICVRGHDARSILAALHARLEHDRDAEQATALAEIAAIGRVRLEAMLS